EEFLTEVRDRGTVLRGRCLPYGEGITFFPLAEVLRNAAGLALTDSPETERSKIEALIEGDAAAPEVAVRVLELIGAVEGSLAAIEEAYWAVRKLFEALGHTRPVIVVLDDLQWAEPGLLDLLDNLTELARDSAILLLCVARPELLDRRVGWGGGKFNATSVMLEPLSQEEA